MADEQVEELGIEGLSDASEVGVGGFATVYKAYQSAFRRTVAVKVLATLNLDESARERFERECQAMGSLSDHPNIVTVHGAGFTSGPQSRPYLVMAYLPGGSLAERIQQTGPLPWQDATLYGVHLAGALETAHRAEVIHRDIKPANVLMSAFGDALLTDFGIARISGGHETRSGVITASMHHAPPEVIDGQRPTVVGDVYSLASTVYELILGRSPFEEAADEGMVPMIRRILTDPPPDLRGHQVPDEVCRVLERAMAKDPAQRPQSALELGRELQAARRAVGLEGGKLTVPADVEAAGGPDIAFVAAPSQILCQSCHGELPPNADTCPTCGTPVGLTAPSGPPPPPGVAAPAAAAPVAAAAAAPAPPAYGAPPAPPVGPPPYVAEPMPAAAGAAGGGKGKVVALAVAVVLALVLGAGAVLALNGGGDETADPPASTTTTSTPEDPTTVPTVDQPEDYTPEVEQNFVNACVQSGGTTRPLCRCVFDGIRASIPFDRFVELEAEVRDQGSLEGTEIQDIVVDCLAESPASAGTS